MSSSKLFVFGSDGKRKRTKVGYDALFEDLMRYTSYKNIGQLETKEDLRAFLNEVRDDAGAKGRTFKVSNKMRFELENSVIRIKDDPILSRKVIRTNKERVIEGKPLEEVLKFRMVKVSKGESKFKLAMGLGMVVPNEEGKAVYKSIRSRKGKKGIVYRDNKGRFAKAPVISLAGSYE